MNNVDFLGTYLLIFSVHLRQFFERKLVTFSDKQSLVVSCFNFPKRSPCLVISSHNWQELGIKRQLVLNTMALKIKIIWLPISALPLPSVWPWASSHLISLASGSSSVQWRYQQPFSGTVYRFHECMHIRCLKWLDVKVNKCQSSSLL